MSRRRKSSSACHHSQICSPSHILGRTTTRTPSFSSPGAIVAQCCLICRLSVLLRSCTTPAEKSTSGSKAILQPSFRMITKRNVYTRICRSVFRLACLVSCEIRVFLQFFDVSRVDQSRPCSSFPGFGAVAGWRSSSTTRGSTSSSSWPAAGSCTSPWSMWVASGKNENVKNLRYCNQTCKHNATAGVPSLLRVLAKQHQHRV